MTSGSMAVLTREPMTPPEALLVSWPRCTVP